MAVITFIRLILISFVTLTQVSHGYKDKAGGAATFGFTEHIAPIYCTNDWMCNTYCTPGTIAYCPSVNKMGPEVKYGTCFCCDDHLGYLQQSSYGCSGSCSQVYARVMAETKSPQACDKGNSNNYFSWFSGPVVRQDANGIRKDKEEHHPLKASM